MKRMITHIFNQFIIHPPIYILWGIYIPFSIWLFYHARLSGQLSMLFFGFGLIGWTLTEYMMHRFVFHYQTQNVHLEKILFFMHGYHHLKPTDHMRYVLPLFITLPAIIFFYLIFLIINSYTAPVITSGFIAGYLLYDTTHYYVHRFRPISFIDRFLKYHHFYHHFKNNQRCFGVSTTFWDYVFQTKSVSVNK